jgi:GNAT superfamily N-acetyltransferase/SAM-dependent methyltransferase
MVKITDFTPETRSHIKTLNEEWLTKYFEVEPHDKVALSDPEGHILDKGGRIFYAAWDDEIVGTASLIPVEAGTYELAKMAVTESAKGKGIGHALMEHCIDVAKHIGASKLILYSNTKLEPAIHLYQKYGFSEVPLGSSVYKRSDIKMERHFGNSALYESEDRVEKSFDMGALPEEQQQAQWAELVELKKAIHEVWKRRKAPIEILDIGVGNGRVMRRLHGIPEVWAQVGRYVGVDNAEACVELTEKTVAELGISDKVSVHFLDVQNLAQWKDQYFDIIMTTWFTGGNFAPLDFPFEHYNPRENRLDLRVNSSFDKVFYQAYQMLRPGGELILGAVYVDSPATRARQEAFYKRLGMTVITDEQDRFTATKERFWSQRFTERLIRKYFHYVSPGKITLIPLDTYDFAMQVRLKKG